MNEFKFTGKITNIGEVKTGTTEEGLEWAALDFEVTEQKEGYPQIGKFAFFKSGEHIKFAKDFQNFNKVGDDVVVSFKLKKNIKKDGSSAFYKTEAWKIEKLNNVAKEAIINDISGGLETEFEEPSQIPF